MAPSVLGPGQRELSIRVTHDDTNGRSVPSSPYETGLPSSLVKPIPSLTEAWEDARKRFSDNTSRSVDVPSVHIERWLEDWEARYKVDDSAEARRKKKILGVIQNIVDGINVVGEIVANGVSTTFGAAGPCFNALSFLLNIPRSIKDVYDTLLELLEEVENFLVRFKILKRTDSMKTLPSEMVVSASNMLISFVDVCGLAYAKLDKHPLQTVLMAAFLRSDSGIGAALADFRRMAQSLDSLTNTVALQNILDVRETTRDTNVMVRESHTAIKDVDRISKSWEQANNDDRTRRAIQNRLEVIKEKIYTNEERTYKRREREMQPEFPEELLSGTQAILEDCLEFCNWRDAPLRSGRAAFLLKGPSGSGKSRVMEVFKKGQDEVRQKADKDKPSVYVAYHLFGGRVNKEATSLIPFALRNMAVQVAEQSTAYAKELENIVKTDKTNALHQDNIEELWKILNLSTFKAKAEATMYLLFDGIEQENPNSVHTLLSLFAGPKAERAKKVDIVSIRALLTIDSERWGDLIPTLDMSVATKGLVKSYTIKELRRRGIFQSSDKKSSKRRERVVDAVSSPNRADRDEPAAWNFKDVKQKLDRIRVAIQNDAPDEELDKILQDENKQSVDPKAKQAVRDLAGSLSVQEISQINQMLPWLLYSEFATCLEVEELEAVLFLAHNSDSLQSLATKIGERFCQLFHRSGAFVQLRPEIEKVFRENEEQSQRQVSAREPLINLQISIQNAEESTIQQFVWQLNEQVSMGKFDFGLYTSAAHNMISVNELDSHISIVKLCLKLLNEGWRDETEILVRYARDFLPTHLFYLAASLGDISASDQKVISQSLVDFLSDPYHLAHDPDRHFGHGEDWLANSEAAAAMRTWLETTQDHLHAREKRWLQDALRPSEGRLGYLKNVACAVGKKWVKDLKENAVERRYYGWGVRTSNSLEIYLFNWLSTYVESNIVEKDSRDPDSGLVVEAESGPSKKSQNPDTVQESETQGGHDDQSPNQPSTADEPYPLARQKTIVETSPGTKIKAAIDWLDENGVFCRKNGAFHINVGYTYLAFGEYPEAEGHFEHAVQDDTSKRQGLTALGRLHFARGQKQDAMVKLDAALSMLECQKAQGGFTDDQNKILAELYREIAAIYKETQPKMLSEAVDLYEKSLECDDDLDVRWKTLKLLCEANQPQEVSRATALLEKWSDHMDKTGDSGLAHDLSCSASQPQWCDHLESFIHAIQDPSLRSHIAQALSQAIKMQEVSEEPEVRAKLLYLRGLALVKEGREGYWLTAVELWREALTTTLSEHFTNWSYPYCLYKAARGVAQHEFEMSMSRLDTAVDHQMSHEERELAVEDLKHGLHKQAFSHPRMYSDGAQRITNRYVVSLNIMMGRVDDARALLAEDMSTVVDILTDDDGDNDVQGIRILMSILCSMGDREGTLSAFSLLDRKAREARVSQENSPVDGETVSDGNVSDYTAECDCCKTIVASDDPKGFWWCQYCADFDLCVVCHDSILSGQLTSPLCNINHNLMHLYHTDYTVAETTGNMVRIGWEWEDLGNGKFSRKGGDIVPLSKWLEKLRETWKLPEDLGDIRAQK